MRNLLAEARQHRAQIEELERGLVCRDEQRALIEQAHRHQDCIDVIETRLVEHAERLEAALAERDEAMRQMTHHVGNMAQVTRSALCMHDLPERPGLSHAELRAMALERIYALGKEAQNVATGRK